VLSHLLHHNLSAKTIFILNDLHPHPEPIHIQTTHLLFYKIAHLSKPHPKPSFDPFLPIVLIHPECPSYDETTKQILDNSGFPEIGVCSSSAVTLYRPSHFATNFPSRAFLTPTYTRLKTRSPVLKSIGFAFLLYFVVVAYFTTTLVKAAKILDSSMKSSSSNTAEIIEIKPIKMETKPKKIIVTF